MLFIAVLFFRSQHISFGQAVFAYQMDCFDYVLDVLVYTFFETITFFFNRVQFLSWPKKMKTRDDSKKSRILDKPESVGVENRIPRAASVAENASSVVSRSAKPCICDSRNWGEKTTFPQVNPERPGSSVVFIVLLCAIAKLRKNSQRAE